MKSDQWALNEQQALISLVIFVKLVRCNTLLGAIEHDAHQCCEVLLFHLQLTGGAVVATYAYQQQLQTTFVLNR